MLITYIIIHKQVSLNETGTEMKMCNIETSMCILASTGLGTSLYV